MIKLDILKKTIKIIEKNMICYQKKCPYTNYKFIFNQENQSIFDNNNKSICEKCFKLIKKK